MKSHIFQGSDDTIKSSITSNITFIKKALTKQFKKKKLKIDFKQYWSSTEICEDMPTPEVYKNKTEDMIRLERMEQKQDKLIDIEISLFQK